MIGLEVAIKKNELTQKEVADRLGISNVNITRWISGTRPIPEKYKKTLSEMLSVPKEYLSKELSITSFTMDDMIKAVIGASMVGHMERVGTFSFIDRGVLTYALITCILEYRKQHKEKDFKQYVNSWLFRRFPIKE